MYFLFDLLLFCEIFGFMLFILSFVREKHKTILMIIGFFSLFISFLSLSVLFIGFSLIFLIPCLLFLSAACLFIFVSYRMQD